MKRWISLIVLAVFLAGCGPAAVIGTPTPPPPPTAIPLPEGVRAIQPPKVLNDYAMTDHEGKPFRIADLKGKYVLFSFGYTNCPDVCPITLAHFRQVKAELGEAAANVQFVFFSVDGARDTPEKLKVYMNAFDAGFIGVTSPDETIRAFITECGGTYDLHNGGGLIKNYTVDHTAGGFLMNPDGLWVRKYVYGTDPLIIADDIRAYLKG